MRRQHVGYVAAIVGGVVVALGLLCMGAPPLLAIVGGGLVCGAVGAEVAR